VPVMGKRVAALEAGLTSVNSDVDAVESRVGGAESDVDVLETEMDTVESDVDSVEDDVASIQNTVSVLEDAVSPLAVGRYQVFLQTTTYEQASDFCKANYGTTLATVRSDEDARDLLKLQNDLGDAKNHLWIGLTMLSGEWKWDSGFNCDGACQNLKWWDDGQPQNNAEYCAVMHGSRVDAIDNQFHDVPCSGWTATAFACDSPVMGPRMAAVETGLTAVDSKVQSMDSRLLSLERIMDGINDAIDSEQGVAVPVGFGVSGDYVLYALVLLNLVVLLGLFAFCMVRRVPMDRAKVQYGRVYETEMDKL